MACRELEAGADPEPAGALCFERSPGACAGVTGDNLHAAADRRTTLGVLTQSTVSQWWHRKPLSAGPECDSREGLSLEAAPRRSAAQAAKAHAFSDGNRVLMTVDWE